MGKWWNCCYWSEKEVEHGTEARTVQVGHDEKAGSHKKCALEADESHTVVEEAHDMGLHAERDFHDGVVDHYIRDLESHVQQMLAHHAGGLVRSEETHCSGDCELTLRLVPLRELQVENQEPGSLYTLGRSVEDGSRHCGIHVMGEVLKVRPTTSLA